MYQIKKRFVLENTEETKLKTSRMKLLTFPINHPEINLIRATLCFQVNLRS